MSVRTELVHKRRDIALVLLRWRHEASLAEKLAASLLVALLTALAAQTRLQLPFTPVPFTGQVLVVLLSGFLLGRFAPVSMGMYLGLGATFGWFSGFQGIAAFTGITSGYLFGFVLAAAIVGHLASSKRIWSLTGISVVMSLGLGAIYLCGASWLCLFWGMSPIQAIALGVIPFILVDVMKLGIAAAVARGISSSEAS